jgi:hypothetical protein
MTNILYRIFFVAFTLISLSFNYINPHFSLALNRTNSTVITNPITQLIPKSKLAISFLEIAQIPDSGKGKQKAARLNFITQANDGSGRLFVNDMRGKLYVINNKVATVYLDLKKTRGKAF